MNLALRSAGKARIGAQAAGGLRHALLVLCEALLESPNEQVCRGSLRLNKSRVLSGVLVYTLPRLHITKPVWVF